MINFREITGKIKTKKLRALIVIIAIILIVFGINKVFSDPVTEVIDEKLTIVEVSSPAKYAGDESFSLIGTVRAFSEAKITAEKSGRVTSVNVGLGQTVSAGIVLATTENASERAQVLQAEGVYEAALAAASQSDLSLSQAENRLRQTKDSAIATIKSAYNTTSGIIYNDIDEFFSNPDGYVVVGLKIDGLGNTKFLNEERLAYQDLLPEWNQKAQNTGENLVVDLDYSRTNIERVLGVIDTFITIFNTQKSSSRYSKEELDGFSGSFVSLRSTLISLQSQIDQAETSLLAAEDDVEKAKLAGTVEANSAANAQVKQALGGLRAAQANLAKTILRTPISGTVNSISVRQGDFINSFAEVAVVANNGSLEIVTNVNEKIRALINVGDEVLVEDKYTGTIVAIAPAVDSKTKKIEVRIALENSSVSNGDTVRISKNFAVEDIEGKAVIVPITAMKFDRENGSVFKVIDSRLVKLPVEVGSVTGASIEIISGLSLTDEIVLDVRGLTEGTEVKVSE